MARRPRTSSGRPGLTSERVVDAAADLVDDEGEAALTLAALAARLGVRAPSLYNHIGGLGALRAALALRALDDLAAALGSAAVGRSGEDALRALARSYRDWARRHPGLYALTQRSAEGGDPALQAAGRRVLDTVLAALRGYGLEGDAALHATRAVRSALHGFALLETGAGFGLALDPDESFERLLDLLHAGLERGVRTV